MIAADPNVASVELVAATLGDLCDHLVLVGGCAASLLIDTPTAPPPRVTTDVDLIVEVSALGEYHALERRFAQRGLTRDVSADAPICRWKAGQVAVDLIPTEENVLGFANRWYVEAARTADRVRLPSGRQIKLVTAPAFLGTKFEAFHTRGQSDMLASHDFEDIINVVEGRANLVGEVEAVSQPLRDFLAHEFGRVLASPNFVDTLPGLVAYDELHDERVSRVLGRLRAIVSLAASRTGPPTSPP